MLRFRPFIWGCCSSTDTSSKRATILFIISYPSSWWAISRPRKKTKIFTLCPSLRNSRTFRSLISKSFAPILRPNRICLSSAAFECLRFFCCYFIFWYWYFPQSTILATGGSAFGEISIKSTPASWAALSASDKLIIPSWSPFAPITRNWLAFISWLIRIDVLIAESP